MNFDYEEYSLENLNTWVHDVVSNDKVTPKQIYDVIYKAVTEDYYYHKHNAGRCYDLMLLFKGNDNIQEQVKTHGELWDKEDKKLTCDKDDKSPECQKAWNDFWEENYYPEEHTQYTEEELNAMCDAASDKEKCREYNLREAEYYDKRAKLDIELESIRKEGGYYWTPEVKDKVVKWQLPVEVDGLTGDCFVQFPDDLLEAADLKEGDHVEWVDQGNGSYLLKKVNA